MGGGGGGGAGNGWGFAIKDHPTIGNLTINGGPGGGETFDYGPKLVPRLFPALLRYMRVP